ncbi:hypothetical protein GWK47_038114 [Chionoecetes opilio]|uniref:Uncharacterized protein n=1 Tax=Chionoecetes opilio TaxID=41210 RepID=A0A8J5CYE6_CHIOP|nr:hypothetical protein GWK47_038114 [Chionoecetes opilio]
MAKGIYALQVFLFQGQVKLTAHELQAMEDISLFVALLYATKWNEAMVPQRAPLNDLLFMRDLSRGIPNQAWRTWCSKPSVVTFEESETWELEATFLDMKRNVSQMKVVNDAAERSIALATSFNSIITKDERERTGPSSGPQKGGRARVLRFRDMSLAVKEKGQGEVGVNDRRRAEAGAKMCLELAGPLCFRAFLPRAGFFRSRARPGNSPTPGPCGAHTKGESLQVGTREAPNVGTTPSAWGGVRKSASKVNGRRADRTKGPNPKGGSRFSAQPEIRTRPRRCRFSSSTGTEDRPESVAGGGSVDRLPVLVRGAGWSSSYRPKLPPAEHRVRSAVLQRWRTGAGGGSGSRFDTPAVNSGLVNGACTLIDRSWVGPPSTCLPAPRGRAGPGEALLHLPFGVSAAPNPAFEVSKGGWDFITGPAGPGFTADDVPGRDELPGQLPRFFDHAHPGRLPGEILGLC